MSWKRSLLESTGYPSRDNDKLKRIGHKENHAGSNFCRCNRAVLSYRGCLCARMREVAIGRHPMSLETVVSLIVSALLLFYLAYALLRPEKF